MVFIENNIILGSNNLTFSRSNDLTFKEHV